MPYLFIKRSHMFGRNEKKRKRRRKKRQSSSSEDSDSEDRVKVGQSNEQRSSKVIIPEELHRQPERGILKNSSMRRGLQIDGTEVRIRLVYK